MKYFTLCAVLGLGLLAVTAKGQSFFATNNGTVYDITIVTGSFNSLQTQLEGTPWWGNETLATDLFFDYGLIQEDGVGTFLSFTYVVAGGTEYFGGGDGPVDVPWYHAVGEVVPAPEPSTLALSGLGALSFFIFRRRK